jgi:hypothetical protein
VLCTDGVVAIAIRLAAFAIAALLTPPSFAVAQTGESRMELGAQIAGLRLVGESGPVLSPGFAPRVHFNLTSHLAIDTRLTFFPRRELSLWQSQGGKTLHFAAGARGKFVTKERFAVYGLLLPGVIHFNAYTLESGERTAPASHFTFDLGGGVEVYPSPRWIARFDYTRTVYFAPGAEFGRSEPSPSGAVLVISTPAQMVPTWQIGAGVFYRLGPALGLQTESPASARLSFGLQMATRPLTRRRSAESHPERKGASADSFPIVSRSTLTLTQLLRRLGIQEEAKSRRRTAVDGVSRASWASRLASVTIASGSSRSSGPA